MFYTILLEAANNSSSEFDYKLIMTVLSALSGAVIGGGITIWYKNAEIKNLLESLRLQSENLNLQKELFKETVVNNELTIKAELVRLEDLNRQYKLSLQKYDFEHLSKVLDFADDKNEKAKMMREFSEMLLKYNDNIPLYFYEFSEYQDYVVDYIFDNLDYIKKGIDSLLSKYPDIFLAIHKDFKYVSNQAIYIGNQAAEYYTFNENVDRDEIIEKLFEDLYSLHEKYNQLIELMQKEFIELDSIKRDYIQNQFSRRIKE